MGKTKVETRRRIMVFSSSLSGIHGAGSAAAALKRGAKWGVSIGPSGDTYAIPTKDEKLRVLPLDVIRKHVEDFIKYAIENQDLVFDVVKIGCGLSGLREDIVAPFFKGSPANVNLPEGWRDCVFPNKPQMNLV